MRKSIALAIIRLLERWSILRSRVVFAFAKPAFHAFGTKNTIALPIRLGGAQCISVGSGLFIGPNSWIQVLLDDPSPKAQVGLYIGSGVSISGDCTIIAKRSIRIEDDVLIGRFVHISDHTHNYRGAGPIRLQGTTEPKPVVIEKGAWLGQGVVVCPGVTIGENAVVAANSLVKTSIPAFALAAGCPAKVVKIIKSA